MKILLLLPFVFLSLIYAKNDFLLQFGGGLLEGVADAIDENQKITNQIESSKSKITNLYQNSSYEQAVIEIRNFSGLLSSYRGRDKKELLDWHNKMKLNCENKVVEAKNKYLQEKKAKDLEIQKEKHRRIVKLQNNAHGFAKSNEYIKSLEALSEMDALLEDSSYVKRNELLSWSTKMRKFCESKLENHTKQIKENFDLESLLDKGKEFQNKSLVFKGFYLGMPITDAQQLINHYLQLEHVSGKPLDTPKSSEGEKQAKYLNSLLGGNKPTGSFRIYRSKGNLLLRRTDENPFAVAGEDGKINKFELSEINRNKLFESGKMPVKEFLQNFIEAYNIPSLEPSRKDLALELFGQSQALGFQDMLIHRSPKGFEFIYWYKPTIYDPANAYYASTGPAKAITIKKIKSAKEMRSKFN